MHAKASGMRKRFPRSPSRSGMQSRSPICRPWHKSRDAASQHRRHRPKSRDAAGQHRRHRRHRHKPPAGEGRRGKTQEVKDEPESSASTDNQGQLRAAEMPASSAVARSKSRDAASQHRRHRHKPPVGDKDVLERSAPADGQGQLTAAEIPASFAVAFAACNAAQAASSAAAAAIAGANRRQ